LGRVSGTGQQPFDLSNLIPKVTYLENGFKRHFSETFDVEALAYVQAAANLSETNVFETNKITDRLSLLCRGEQRGPGWRWCSWELTFAASQGKQRPFDKRVSQLGRVTSCNQILVRNLAIKTWILHVGEQASEGIRLRFRHAALEQFFDQAIGAKDSRGGAHVETSPISSFSRNCDLTILDWHRISLTRSSERPDRTAKSEGLPPSSTRCAIS
jgi:hypothetical protein